jgi:hypothetical protein
MSPLLSDMPKARRLVSKMEIPLQIERPTGRSGYSAVRNMSFFRQGSIRASTTFGRETTATLCINPYHIQPTRILPAPY